ncbi:MAG: hypothetical protein EAZ14_08915 [Runella slithyformis]|nr:MAG: hypothetical protein EAZ14_08915 [Runella slithyformis]
MILKKIARLSFSDPIQSALKPAEMWFCVLLIAILMLKEHFCFYISTHRNWSFFALFSFLAVVCYFFGVYNSKQFIYFQF